MEEKIGKKIRELRILKGMTLKELSELTNLSVSFLSQVERGVSSLTITSLKIIANAFNVQMKDLIDIDEKMTFVNRKDNQRFLHFEKSYIRYLKLSGKFDGRKLESFLLTMKPNFYDYEMTEHEGEEFYYIIEGKATFIVDDIEYSIYEGEVMHFPSKLSHKIINKESTELVMLCVSTPIIF